MFAHVVYGLETNPAMNPWAGVTWRDEDFIGKLMKCVKAQHAKGVATRTLEFYAVRLRIVLDL